MVALKNFRVNNFVAALAIKAPCKVVTNTNLTLSGQQTVNGVAVVAGDRVLVKDQTDPIENGIYDVETSAWQRSADFDGNRDVVNGTLMTVASGTAVDQYQLSTSDPITIDTTALTIDTFSPALDIGGRPAVVTPAPTDEFVVNQGGVEKKMTRLQVHTLEAGEQFLADFGSAAAPGYAFNGQTNLGFTRPAANTIGFVATGALRFRLLGNGQFHGENAVGPVILDETSSATNPTVCANRNNNTTGMGHTGTAGEGTLIGDSVEVARFTEAAGVVQVVLPLQNNAANPSLVVDGASTGFYSQAAGSMSVSVGGNHRWLWSGLAFRALDSTGPRMLNEAASATNPTMIPRGSNEISGMGSFAVDNPNCVLQHPHHVPKRRDLDLE